VKLLKKASGRAAVAAELFEFLMERKLWWLIPFILLLLIFASLFIFAQGTGVAPFVYTLF